MTLNDLKTPALVLERGRLARNIAAMTRRMKRLGVRLRPHMKTAKSAKIAEFAVAGNFGGIAVSTVAEANYFANAGYRDITYAVALVPAKLYDLAPLIRDGVRVNLITDDAGVAEALGARAEELGLGLHLLIEVDTGQGRSGVTPESAELLEIGHMIHRSPHLSLEGVLTHAGHSYRCSSAKEVRAVAEEERAGIVRAAERLKREGLPCPTVSAGSTPTAVHVQSLEGVTEMRPGNYVFFDLEQLGIGSCELADIAVSVLATVIGHNRRSGAIVLDAGALALSKDVSAQALLPDAGYGWVFDRLGRARIDGLRITQVYQEHGLAQSEGPAPFEGLPVGSLVRILPNHSCLTCAMYDRYHVVDGGDQLVDVWSRINGW